MIKTKNQMTQIIKMYRLKKAHRNLNMTLNIHVMIHRTYDVNIEPPLVGEFSAPEVVSH